MQRRGSKAVRWCPVIAAMICVMGLPPWARADDPKPALSQNFPWDVSTILFLGDSNTYAGQYIALLETQLRLQAKERRLELINLGLPSETCSGLSEPDHPFPRPNVHDRLDRALAETKPDVVVVSYGINDGIYYPWSDERFRAFQDGVDRLIAKCHAAGAAVILLTPPVFDAVPLQGTDKLRDEKSDKFAWFAIYQDYDDVMHRYANWLLEQQDRVAMVIDVHRAMRQFLEEKRRDDPPFTLSRDGIHFDQRGHALLARLILESWGVPEVKEVKATVAERVAKRQQLMRDAWLSHVGHQRPGVAAGLSLAEARQQAHELDVELDADQD